MSRVRNVVMDVRVEGGRIREGLWQLGPESGMNISYWNNCRLLHRERVFLHIAFREDVPLIARLNCRKALSGFPIMYLLFLLFDCLFVCSACSYLSHEKWLFNYPVLFFVIFPFHPSSLFLFLLLPRGICFSVRNKCSPSPCSICLLRYIYPFNNYSVLSVSGTVVGAWNMAGSKTIKNFYLCGANILVQWAKSRTNK